jgi:energy-coupling factor transport system substrate-specific component
VATLAAFAALGRIAFVALPNVKPTTDIVLISGYALGPAPGFVVGAVAALTSNFFFGQGPWTPWQMAGWGATGLIGAGLGPVARRRLGRWTLAVICALVGFAFTAFQDFGDWVTYSDHSLAQLGVYAGRGVGFDAVHAAGCLVFALVFGPALARSVGRFATRLEVTWTTVTPLLVIAVLAVALAPSSATDTAHAATNPAGYLLSAQNPDGGFGGAPGQPSAALFSGWAALGLAADGYNPRDVSKDGHSLLDYLSAGATSASDPGSIERTILAVRAAGLNPDRFGGTNLVAALERDVGGNGSVSGQTNLTAFAVLALRAAGLAPGQRTLSWLVRQRDRDGGFNFGVAGAVSDVDDTGAALEALAGVTSSTAAKTTRRAVAFIERHQNRDGGFPQTAGAVSNAQSTAWAIQGLLAAGVRGAPVSGGLSYLRSLIAPDGHVRYSRSLDQTPVWVTAEAAMALAEKPLPLAALATRSKTVTHRARRATRRAHTVGAPRHRRKPRLTRTPQVKPSRLSMTLAADAGVLDALMLAPIGVG